MRKRTLFGLALSVVAAVFTGCSSGSTDAGGPGGTANQANVTVSGASN